MEVAAAVAMAAARAEREAKVTVAAREAAAEDTAGHNSVVAKAVAEVVTQQLQWVAKADLMQDLTSSPTCTTSQGPLRAG